MSRIGFIGLGNMGAPMAANLAKADHGVIGFDVAGVTVEGVANAESAAAAAANQDIVITMLPDGPIVRSVYQDIVKAAAPGSCMVDCSTIDVENSRAAHGMAGDAGLLSVDAPVSGGVGGAVAGTLTFMAGGSEEAFAVAAPAFEIMGQKAVHCGEAGAGQVAKICNNMILAITMIGVGEGFGLGQKLGLDPKKLFDVVSTSSGSCWAVNTYCPVAGVGPTSPADNAFKPGFAAELMMKDTKLSQDAAGTAGAATPLGAHATELFRQFVEAGGRGKDFSGIVEMIQAMER
ncbi:MAG: 3-hydroxyisobutyrate dehydrogenase [Alphaproteobacteria bacterium]|nr:3-hydroxyisobutyrate dehydrogenase [Alphaproteobacteria bacterium]